MVPHTPAAVDHLLHFPPGHVPEAVVTGVAETPYFADVAGHRFHMSRYIERLMNRHGAFVQFDQRFVVRDGIDPFLAMFPVTNSEGH
jgi:hypothetical protein